MLIRSGVDIVYVERVNRLYSNYKEQFLNKIFTKNEIADCLYDDKIKIAKLAKKFAAKEAFSKAIGTGIGKLSFRDIEILNIKTGEPVVVLSNKIKLEIENIFKCNNVQVSLSLSDEKDIAVAFVTILLL